MENKPIILRAGSFTQDDLETLRKNKIWRTVDIYEHQMEELYKVKNPGKKGEGFNKFLEESGRGDLAGAWVYYPWSGVLLHTVSEEELYDLRTNRNRNIVTEEEQQTLRASTVAVAGMSVGSGIALSCVYAGMSQTIKIADFDSLDTSNLNRLRESIYNVGTSKTALAAQKVYEINPFTEVHGFSSGINSENIEQFFHDPDIRVVVDEIDDFKMKVQLRVQARKSKVPLLMFTSLGDNILVDIERYDIDSELPLFNGAIGDVPEEIIAKDDISENDIRQYSVRLVGAQYVPTRALESLLDIGSTLVGRPQLYSTIAVDGGLAAYIIRQILLNETVPSGRYFIKFADLFNLSAVDLEDSPKRQAILERLLK